MLTIPISITILALYYAGLHYLTERKTARKVKGKVKFINECQAPVIRLEDGRKLNNVKTGS